jgi:hypothetical protein
MKNKINISLKCCCLICFTIFLVSCFQNVREDKYCSKFANEIYNEVVTDTSLAREAFDYQKIMLEKFGETSIKGLNYEAYLLQFYSTHGYGKSVKFENKNGVYAITVKCNGKVDWVPDCKEYKIRINREEWNVLENMIYEFDFWTVEDFKVKRDVLDGSAYFLEGNRPEAERCNKKTYKLIARGSPDFDKMRALGDYIFDYEDQLKFRYEQMK